MISVPNALKDRVSDLARPSAKDAPHYIPGTIAIAACMGVETITIICWKLWLMYVNKKKAKAIAAMGISQEEAERRGQELGAEDVTDMKNPYFVYVVLPDSRSAGTDEGISYSM